MLTITHHKSEGESEISDGPNHGYRSPHYFYSLKRWLIIITGGCQNFVILLHEVVVSNVETNFPFKEDQKLLIIAILLCKRLTYAKT